MCHLILLLPVLALPVFWIWPVAVAVPVYLFVLVISAIVYYLALAAMRRPVRTGPERLLGSDGNVMNVQGKLLAVRIGSEIWGAESPDELHPGDVVQVVGIEGLQLKVRREDDGRFSGHVA